MSERITERDLTTYKRDILDKILLISPREAAQILSCSERTLHRLVREGVIHAYGRPRAKGSRGLRFLASEVRQYVQSIKIDKEKWRE